MKYPTVYILVYIKLKTPCEANIKDLVFIGKFHLYYSFLCDMAKIIAVEQCIRIRRVLIPSSVK